MFGADQRKEIRNLKFQLTVEQDRFLEAHAQNAKLGDRVASAEKESELLRSQLKDEKRRADTAERGLRKQTEADLYLLVVEIQRKILEAQKVTPKEKERLTHLQSLYAQQNAGLAQQQGLGGLGGLAGAAAAYGSALR